MNYERYWENQIVTRAFLKKTQRDVLSSDTKAQQTVVEK